MKNNINLYSSYGFVQTSVNSESNIITENTQKCLKEEKK